MANHDNCKYEKRWSDLLTGMGRVEGKVDAIQRQINGSVTTMTQHMKESEIFRQQVTSNNVWIILFRWIVFFLVSGTLSIWFYLIKQSMMK
jgi:hypothetical protein